MPLWIHDITPRHGRLCHAYATLRAILRCFCHAYHCLSPSPSSRHAFHCLFTPACYCFIFAATLMPCLYFRMAKFFLPSSASLLPLFSTLYACRYCRYYIYATILFTIADGEANRRQMLRRHAFYGFVFRLCLCPYVIPHSSFHSFRWFTFRLLPPLSCATLLVMRATLPCYYFATSPLCSFMAFVAFICHMVEHIMFVGYCHHAHSL